MLITLVLLSLSLTPVIVISSPLNVEPIDITKRETACIASSNCSITNDHGGKPGKPEPYPVDAQPTLPSPSGNPDTKPADLLTAPDTPWPEPYPVDAQPTLPSPSGNPDTKPADLLTAPDTPWPDPDKGPELFDFEYKCRGRSEDDQRLVLDELLVARDILKKGYRIFSLSPFYQAMFAPSLRNNPSFELQAQTKYAYAFAIFTRSDYKVKITCDQNLCDENTVALVIAQLNILNLCEPWFDDSVKAKSEVAANECKAGNEKANNWKNLAKFKATKSFTLVHEIMHTKYPTQGVDTPPRADDYAYGVPHCKDLAAGNRDDVRCGPERGVVGRCDASKSFENADSLAFVPAGEYWTERCEKEVEVDNTSGVLDPVDYDDEDLLLDG